jgi:methionyl-tRNA formyltransferase
MLDGGVVPVAQAAAGVSYGAQRTPDDGLVDWRAPARRLHDFVRAQSDPYPGAFTWLQGRRMTIWRARPYPHPYFGAPGQVVRIDADGVHVACGEGSALTLLEVERDGVRDAAGRIVDSTRVRFGERG